MLGEKKANTRNVKVICVQAWVEEVFSLEETVFSTWQFILINKD